MSRCNCCNENGDDLRAQLAAALKERDGAREAAQNNLHAWQNANTRWVTTETALGECRRRLKFLEEERDAWNAQTTADHDAMLEAIARAERAEGFAKLVGKALETELARTARLEAARDEACEHADKNRRQADFNNDLYDKVRRERDEAEALLARYFSGHRVPMVELDELRSLLEKRGKLP